MSRCDNCMRDVDDGVSCGDCTDTDFWERRGYAKGRAAGIAQGREDLRRAVVAHLDEWAASDSPAMETRDTFRQCLREVIEDLAETFPAPAGEK
jgi:hypothetical protein